MKGEYNKSSGLLKYDCIKARKYGVESIKDDLKLKGYTVTNYEYIPFLFVAVVEIKIIEIIHPDYITELTPLWNFKN